MKKLLILSAVLALLSTAAAAQEQTKNTRLFGFLDEISVGVGIVPTDFATVTDDIGDDYYPESYYFLSTDLSGLYEPKVKDRNVTLILFAETGTFINSWLRLGMHLGYYRENGDLFLPISGETTQSFEYNKFYILPELRFIWMMNSNMGYYLYSGLDAGCKLTNGHYGLEKISKTAFAGDVVPIGIATIKRKVRVAAEYAIGLETIGARVSISYAF